MKTPLQRLKDVMINDLVRLYKNEEKGSKVIKEYIELIDEVWLDVEKDYIKNYVKDSIHTNSIISSK